MESKEKLIIFKDNAIMAEAEKLFILSEEEIPMEVKEIDQNNKVKVEEDEE